MPAWSVDAVGARRTPRWLSQNTRVVSVKVVKALKCASPVVLVSDMFERGLDDAGKDLLGYFFEDHQPFNLGVANHVGRNLDHQIANRFGLAVEQGNEEYFVDKPVCRPRRVADRLEDSVAASLTPLVRALSEALVQLFVFLSCNAISSWRVKFCLRYGRLGLNGRR
jgi:hypothetical protein